MPTTQNGWPYPAATDTPDVPRDLAALANKGDALSGSVLAVESTLSAHDTRIKTWENAYANDLPMSTAVGGGTMNINASSHGQVAITLPVGRFDYPPAMFMNINDVQGAAARLTCRVANVTISGAVLHLYTGDATNATATVNVEWFAIQQKRTSAYG